MPEVTLTYDPCDLCPRRCGVNRTIETGYCGCNDRIKIARAALHFWEEPCISGNHGSGTVFFCGCSLRCRFCQNYPISIENFGKEISIDRLAEIFLELQGKGAHNINLVTATQYLPQILQSISLIKTELHIPVLFNSGGYERVETLKTLDGYIDIYLPDIKYFSSDLSWKYSEAKDYFHIAAKAVKEMVRQTDGLVYDKNGMLQKGVIIRHLVLPGAKDDSFAILEWIHENLPEDKYLLSLMSQYTPVRIDNEFKELNRRVTSYEYDLVVQRAVKLGLSSGFIQERSSAANKYTPVFDLEGV